MTTTDRSRVVDRREGVVGSSNPRGVKLVGGDDYLNFSKYADPPIAPPRRGASVRMGLDTDGYIRELQVLDEAAASGDHDRSRDIRRQVAIKTAAQLVGAFAQTHEEVKVDHVFPLADKILAWLEQ